MRSLNFCIGIMLQSPSQGKIRVLPSVNSCLSMWLSIGRQLAR